MCPVGLMALTIIAAGAAGGAANFLLRQIDQKVDKASENGSPDQTGASTSDTNTVAEFLSYVSIGIVAAFTVPLFLSLAQSGLFAKALGANGTDVAYAELFILAGFCIVAGFSSRAFLGRLTDQVLSEVKKKAEKNEQAIQKHDEKIQKHDEQIKDVSSDVEEVTSEIESLDSSAGNSNVESLADDGPAPHLVAQAQAIKLGRPEQAVLVALSKKQFRTASGLAKSAGVSRTEISEILEELVQKNLAEKTTSPNTGGRRYQLAPLGKAALWWLERFARKTQGADQ